jgi:hypothetical protein
MKKNNTVYIIAGLVLTLLIAGCSDKSSRETAEDVPVITVSGIEESIQDTSFLKLHDIVFLETVDNDTVSSLIAGITKIAEDDGYLFVFDRMQKHKVFIFDRSGKFLNQINRKGQGPHEYMELVDISVDNVNKMLMLLCSIPEKIMYFSYAGKFIREERNSAFYSNMAKDSNFIYLDKGSYPNMKSGSLQIDIKNLSDNSMRSELPYVEGIKNDCFNNGIALTKGKSSIHFVRRYDFNIYQFVDGHVVNKYFVDFQKYKAPDDLKERTEGVFDYCRENQRVFSMTNIVDNGRMMMFYTDLATFFYDKRADLLTGYKEFIISNGPDIRHVSIYDPYLPIAGTDRIAYSIEAIAFLAYYKLPEGRNQPEDLNRDSNPVLLIYELK